MKLTILIGLTLCAQVFGASNVVGLWHFDEGNGQVAHDASKYPNDGHLGALPGPDANDPSWVAGKFGSALHFDGTSSVVQVPNSSSLSITGSITLEAWVKLDSYKATLPVISKWNDVTAQNRGYYLGLNNGYVRFDVSHTGLFGGATCTVNYTYAFACTQSALVYAFTPIQLNQWTHIAGTFDSSTKTLSVYIDGVLSNSVVAENSNIFNMTEPVLMGAADFGGATRQYFPGAIDEPRVWSRALSSAEVLSSAQAGLRALWHFNGDATDSSGLGNDAAVVGATFMPNGEFKGALSFDGNDYAYAGDNVSLGITGPITVEAWVNMNALPAGINGFAPIIAKWNDNAGPYRSYALAITPDGSVRFDVSHTGGFSCVPLNNFGPQSCATSQSAFAVSAKKISLHTWNHIAGTFDGHTLQVFVNGDPDTSIATQASTIFRTGYPVAFDFAYEGSIGTQFANGLIDEAKIWARGLSAAEIAFEAKSPSAAELHLPSVIGQSHLEDNGGGDGSGAIFQADLVSGVTTPVMFLEFVIPAAAGATITDIDGHPKGPGMAGSVIGATGLNALFTGKAPPKLEFHMNLSDKTKLNTELDWH